MRVLISWLPVLLVATALAGASCSGSGDPAAGADRTVASTSASGISMVLLPGGAFFMGSSVEGGDAAPRHEVTVSPFAMDAFEVTQAEYAALEVPNPSQFKSPRRPVEQVRWSDAALFCNERSAREGLTPCYDEVTFACDYAAEGYRLPTEAEWEYAARAGSDRDSGLAAPAKNLGNYACYLGNSKKKTEPVGRRKPNAWGLHDLLGNVQEWCNDVYDAGYYGRSPRTDPRGPDAGKQRVMRGGAWNSARDGCRTTTRYAEIPGITDACFARNTFGFRCVRRLTPEELRLVAGPAGGDSASSRGHE